jgi:hypothetical protein
MSCGPAGPRVSWTPCLCQPAWGAAGRGHGMGHIRLTCNNCSSPALAHSVLRVTARPSAPAGHRLGDRTGIPALGPAAWPPWWSSSAAYAHAVVVSVLTPAEILIAARRLAGTRPHLAAVAGIVHQEDLWQLYRGELTGVDVRIDGWDIRGRWFGVIVGATPRLGELRRGETIPWRVIAAHMAPPERRGSR